MYPHVEDERRGREREAPGLAPRCTNLACGRLEPCPPPPVRRTGRFLSRTPACHQARPWAHAPPLQLRPPLGRCIVEQVSGPSGGGVVGLALARLPRAASGPAVNLEDSAGDGEALWWPQEAS